MATGEVAIMEVFGKDLEDGDWILNGLEARVKTLRQTELNPLVPMGILALGIELSD